MDKERIRLCRPRLLVILLLSVFPAALTFTSCAKKEVQAERRMAAPVLVAKVQTQEVPVQVTGIGTVEAYSTVSVKSLVAGSLDQINFTEGQDVKQDALLFTIDPRPYQAALVGAQANLARDTAMVKQAEATVAKDQANAQNAAVEKSRYEQLYQKGVTPKEQYDQASATSNALEAAVRADQAAVDTSNQAIRADQATIDAAKLNLDYCYIRSPIDGRTGTLLVHRGNIVKSNDTILLSINQVRPIYVDFSVPESNLSAIRQVHAHGKVPMEASIANDSGPPEQGTLSFIDNAVNTATGTILLKGIFDNKTDRLWPGQFVNVTMTLETLANAVVVPNAALQTGQAGQFVFVVKPDMTVESRPVKVGSIFGDKTVIEKGLQPGETVVTDGQIRLVPGARVQIKTAL